MTQSILLTADWHVRRRDQIWGRYPQIQGDLSYGLRQLLEAAAAYDVAEVWIAGDVLDEPIQHSSAVQRLREVLDTLKRQNRVVRYVQGQHELANPSWLSALHDWPQHMHGKKVECALGKTVVGLDYCARDKVAEALRQVEIADILLTHQVWTDWMGAFGCASWSDIPSEIRLTVSGDYHKHCMTVSQALDFPRLFISPGPLCAQSLTQHDAKGVYLLHEQSVESVPLRSRNIFFEEVRSEDALVALLDCWQQHPARVPQQDVPLQISTNILRVRYAAEINEARRRLRSRIMDDVHLMLEVLPEARVELSAPQEARIAAVSGGMPEVIRQFYAEPASVARSAIRLWESKGSLRDDIQQLFVEQSQQPEQ